MSLINWVWKKKMSTNMFAYETTPRFYTILNDDGDFVGYFKLDEHNMWNYYDGYHDHWDKDCNRHDLAERNNIKIMYDFKTKDMTLFSEDIYDELDISPSEIIDVQPMLNQSGPTIPLRYKDSNDE